MYDNPVAPASQAPVRDGPEACDRVLVERLRAGDSRAFEPIIRRHNQRLFRIARSVLRDDDDAEDAVQDGYVLAFTRLDTYAPTGSFSAWLNRIVLNEALARLRAPARARRVSLDQQPPGDVTDNGTGDPMTATERSRFRGLMEDAIDALPGEFRTVFMMRAVLQMSISETARCLDIPAATVKTRYHRAQRLVRQHLAHRVDAFTTDAFAFAGERCDRIVARVLARLTCAGQQRH